MPKQLFSRVLNALLSSATPPLIICLMKYLFLSLTVWLTLTLFSIGEPAPTNTPPVTLRERIEQDYLLQFLVYQRQDCTLKAKLPCMGMGPSADAMEAVDGLKNGKAGFHTDQENPPWWQVDLGSVQPIAKVRNYNRLDSADVILYCARLVISTSDDAKTWSERYRHDGRPVGGALKNDPLEVVLPAAITARYLRIQLPPEDKRLLYLHLD